MTAAPAMAEAFRALHDGDRPLQLVNVWDVLSAKAAVAGGAVALGTSSFAVAAAHGSMDDEVLGFDTVLALAGAIASAVKVPLTVDIEAGRGATPADVAESVRAVVERGAAGVNIEDKDPSQPDGLRPVEEQAARLRAAREAADAVGVPLFVNARSDIWFGSTVAAEQREAEVRSRASAYRDAGADGLFLPGLLDLDALRAVCADIPMPVNVMTAPGGPDIAALAAAGVRRISQGGNTFLATVGAIASVTRRYLAGESVPAMELIGDGFGALPTLMQP